MGGAKAGRQLGSWGYLVAGWSGGWGVARGAAVAQIVQEAGDDNRGHVEGR